MSIQTYNRIIPIYLTYLNGNRLDDECPYFDNPLKYGLGCDFQVNFKVLSGNDRYKIRGSNFSLLGIDEELELRNGVFYKNGLPLIGIEYDKYVSNAFLALNNAGSVFASDMSKLCKGVICGFFCRLGKYRQDEAPVSVPSGDNSFIDVDLITTFNSEHCLDDETSRIVLDEGNSFIRFPWVKENVSRSDVKDFVKGWHYVDSKFGITFNLGYTRFADLSKTSILGFVTSNVSKIRAVEHSINLGDYKVNNDSEKGFYDNVISKKF